ncbi:hypothetical protein NMY22_g7247 [Coprinellus aureogranulatus]|nr:hypothetical protein NMY22_g7247 [Coprinellus aureogranulatus]
MRPFKLDQRIVRHVQAAYPSPQISLVRFSLSLSLSVSCTLLRRYHEEWLKKTSLAIVEAHGPGFPFDFSVFAQEVSTAIGRTPLAKMIEQGTGLPHGINQGNSYTILNEVVLELVHLTDIGVRALTLEGVRQEREHRIYLDRVAHTSASEQAKTLRDLEWLRPDLIPYPRKCLKLFLSDGTVELQAIEAERLCGIELGITPMGTKVRSSFER